MDKLVKLGAGARQHEYALVAYPDNAIADKIIIERKLINHTVRNEAHATCKPHITLASFKATEAMEGTIIRYMQRICMLQQSFSVVLNNFSSFPPDTLYLRVQNHMPFKKLVNEMKAVNQYVSSCACPPVHFNAYPHITLAKGLSATNYLQVILHYSQKTFHESFEVSELLLLRRNHLYDEAKPIHIFHLQPAGKSAALFPCN